MLKRALMADHRDKVSGEEEGRQVLWVSLALKFLTCDMGGRIEKGWGQSDGPLSLGCYMNRNKQGIQQAKERP